jgi:hypothetical protein
MPVIPETDPATCTFDELAASVRARLEWAKINQRNVDLMETMLASGQPRFPVGGCPDCGEVLPIRDDGTIECPSHGVFQPPDGTVA